MAKKTLCELNMLYFESVYGAKEIISRNKYRMMEFVARDGKPRYAFFGSNGAIRLGSSKAADKSISYTNDATKMKIKSWAEQVGHI